MNKSVNNHFTIPPSIELLFNNEKLDLMKFLCLLYAFSLKSNRKIRVSELLFYYGLVNFNLRMLLENNTSENNIAAEPSLTLYFRFQSKIQKIILDISFLQFAIVYGDLSKKLDEVTLKITPEGISILEELDSPFFRELTKNYSEVIDSVKFTVSNFKIIAEGE